MRLVVLGKSNQEIAGELFLAVGTVKTHILNILVKTEQKTARRSSSTSESANLPKRDRFILASFIWANANRRGEVVSLRGGFWFMISFASICNA